MVDRCNEQVEDNLGQVNAIVVAIAIAQFFFILIANWMEMIPSEPNEHCHLLPGADGRHQPHLRDGAVR